MDLLAGFRVVEIAHPFTEFAGQIFAGLGAELWLVETADGSPTRSRTPRVPGAESSSRASLAFLARNTNKRSIVIEDARALTELCNGADVVLDCGSSVWHAALTNVETPVVVTITDRLGLGNSSIVGFAASGGMASSGWADRAPCNAPSWLAHDGASIYAAVMAMVATLNGGGRVEVPYEEAAVASITPWTRTLMSYGMQAAGQGINTVRMGDAGFPIYATADGYVRILLATTKSWGAFVGMLGNPPDLTEGPFADAEFRRENADALKLLSAELISRQTTNELFRRGQALGLTISPVYSLEEFRSDPHVREREVIAEVNDPEFGAMDLVRPPFRLTGADVTQLRPAPALGDGGTAPPHRSHGLASRLLADLTVLQLGVGAVVPEAASMLALLGANVIKVESRVHLDFLRNVGLNGPLDYDNCPNFNQLNLGTRSLAVDLRTEEGVDVVRQLAARADVIMENMRGGVVERWGLDYASVRAVNPDVVYLSSQGFGRGVYDGFQSFGPNLQTFSGTTHLWAHADDPFPVGTTLNHPDHVAGKQALVPVLAALALRKGLFVEAAQFEAAASLISDRLLEQFYTDGPIAGRGNGDADFLLHGCFPCEGEDAWIAVAVESEDQQSRLTEAVGADIAAWTSTRSAPDAETELRSFGIPCSRVVTGDDMAANRSSLFATLPHPTSGTRDYTGLPVLIEGERPGAVRPPLLGEHTEEILHGVLGMDETVVADYVARKVVGY